MSASSANNSTEEYIKKLNDRVFQGRKDWVAITGKVRDNLSTIYCVCNLQLPFVFVFEYLKTV